MSFCSLIKGTTPKILMLRFVPVNSVLVNLLCVWILSQIVFTRVLKRHVASKVSILYSDMTEGADIVKLTAAISIDRSAEIRSTLQWLNQSGQSMEGGCRKGRLGVRWGESMEASTLSLLSLSPLSLSFPPSLSHFSLFSLSLSLLSHFSLSLLHPFIHAYIYINNACNLISIHQ